MRRLRLEIEAHPAVNHLFLNRCATSPFAREDYRVFGENHFPLVCVFTSYLERLLVRAPDERRQAVAREGAGRRVRRGLRRARTTRRSTDTSSTRPAATPCPTRGRARCPSPRSRSSATHRRIVARGAVPRRPRRGRPRPRVGNPEDVPRGDPRPPPRGLHRRGDRLLHAPRRAGRRPRRAGSRRRSRASATTHEARQQIRRGAMLSLEARGRFWGGVQRAVVRWRQPRAVRPDGATPRTVLQEVLVTAWDGIAAAARASRPRYDALHGEAPPSDQPSSSSRGGASADAASRSSPRGRTSTRPSASSTRWISCSACSASSARSSISGSRR